MFSLVKKQSFFFNYGFDKGKLRILISWFFQKYGEPATFQLVGGLKGLGFEHATQSGSSIGVDDLSTPPTKLPMLSTVELSIQDIDTKYQQGLIHSMERFQQTIGIWQEMNEKIKEEVVDHFSSTDLLNPVYMMAFSGARGNISQVRQLVGMRGLMADPEGGLIDFPIRSNFREGLTLTEYVISCYGARKGLVDTALRTATSGYLTRRLVDVSQHVVVSSWECGTRRGIFLSTLEDDKNKKVISSFEDRLIGRTLFEDVIIPQDEADFHTLQRLDPFLRTAARVPEEKQHPSNPPVSLQTFSSVGDEATGRPVGLISSASKDVPSLKNTASSSFFSLKRGSKASQNEKSTIFKIEDYSNLLFRRRRSNRKTRRFEGATKVFKNTQLSRSKAALLAEIRDRALVRSPLTCEQEHSVCQLCYGWALSSGNLVSLGEAVGVIAGQSIGEPGTQLTMRTFHTGGVFSGELAELIRATGRGVVSFKNPLPGSLVRTQNGKIAFLTKAPGVLHFDPFPLLLTEKSSKQSLSNLRFENKNKKTGGCTKQTIFALPPAILLFVKQGERVEKGQPLAQLSGMGLPLASQEETHVKSEMEGEVITSLPITGKEEGRISFLILFGKLVGTGLHGGHSLPRHGDLIDKSTVVYSLLKDNPFNVDGRLELYQQLRQIPLQTGYPTPSNLQIKDSHQTYGLKKTYSSLPTKLFHIRKRWDYKANLKKERCSVGDEATGSFLSFGAKGRGAKTGGVLRKRGENKTKSGDLHSQVFAFESVLQKPILEIFYKDIQYTKTGYLFAANPLRVKAPAPPQFSQLLVRHSLSQSFAFLRDFLKFSFLQFFDRADQTTTGGTLYQHALYFDPSEKMGESLVMKEKTRGSLFFVEEGYWFSQKTREQPNPHKQPRLSKDRFLKGLLTRQSRQGQTYHIEAPGMIHNLTSSSRFKIFDLIRGRVLNKRLPVRDTNTKKQKQIRARVGTKLQISSCLSLPAVPSLKESVRKIDLCVDLRFVPTSGGVRLKTKAFRPSGFLRTLSYGTASPTEQPVLREGGAAPQNSLQGVQHGPNPLRSNLRLSNFVSNPLRPFYELLLRNNRFDNLRYSNLRFENKNKKLEDYQTGGRLLHNGVVKINKKRSKPNLFKPITKTNNLAWRYYKGLSAFPDGLGGVVGDHPDKSIQQLKSNRSVGKGGQGSKSGHFADIIVQNPLIFSTQPVSLNTVRVTAPFVDLPSLMRFQHHTFSLNLSRHVSRTGSYRIQALNNRRDKMKERGEEQNALVPIKDLNHLFQTFSSVGLKGIIHISEKVSVFRPFIMPWLRDITRLGWMQKRSMCFRESSNRFALGSTFLKDPSLWDEIIKGYQTALPFYQIFTRRENQKVTGRINLVSHLVTRVFIGAEQQNFAITGQTRRKRGIVRWWLASRPAEINRSSSSGSNRRYSNLRFENKNKIEDLNKTGCSVGAAHEMDAAGFKSFERKGRIEVIGQPKAVVPLNPLKDLFCYRTKVPPSFTLTGYNPLFENSHDSVQTRRAGTPDLLFVNQNPFCQGPNRIQLKRKEELYPYRVYPLLQSVCFLGSYKSQRFFQSKAYKNKKISTTKGSVTKSSVRGSLQETRWSGVNPAHYHPDLPGFARSAPESSVTTVATVAFVKRIDSHLADTKNQQTSSYRSIQSFVSNLLPLRVFRLLRMRSNNRFDNLRYSNLRFENKNKKLEDYSKQSLENTSQGKNKSSSSQPLLRTRIEKKLAVEKNVRQTTPSREKGGRIALKSGWVFFSREKRDSRKHHKRFVHQGERGVEDLRFDHFPTVIEHFVLRVSSFSFWKKSALKECSPFAVHRERGSSKRLYGFVKNSSSYQPLSVINPSLLRNLRESLYRQGEAVKTFFNVSESTGLRAEISSRSFVKKLKLPRPSDRNKIQSSPAVAAASLFNVKEVALLRRGLHFQFVTNTHSRWKRMENNSFATPLLYPERSFRFRFGFQSFASNHSNRRLSNLRFETTRFENQNKTDERKKGSFDVWNTNQTTVSKLRDGFASVKLSRVSLVKGFGFNWCLFDTKQVELTDVGEPSVWFLRNSCSAHEMGCSYGTTGVLIQKPAEKPSGQLSRTPSSVVKNVFLCHSKQHLSVGEVEVAQNTQKLPFSTTMIERLSKNVVWLDGNYSVNLKVKPHFRPFQGKGKAAPPHFISSHIRKGTIFSFILILQFPKRFPFEKTLFQCQFVTRPVVGIKNLRTLRKSVIGNNLSCVREHAPSSNLRFDMKRPQPYQTCGSSVGDEATVGDEAAGSFLSLRRKGGEGLLLRMRSKNRRRSREGLKQAAYQIEDLKAAQAVEFHGVALPLFRASTFQQVNSFSKGGAKLSIIDYFSSKLNPQIVTTGLSGHSGEVVVLSAQSENDNLNRANQNIFVVTEHEQAAFPATQKRGMMKIGDFVLYGESLADKSKAGESGQLIEIDSHKMVLRRGQWFANNSLFLEDGRVLEQGSPIMNFSYQRSKTEDIVQGIPRIEQFFEARSPKEKELLSAEFERVTEEHLQHYPTTEALLKSYERLQSMVVTTIQRMYLSQGVGIADKHVEIVVKQMTSAVLVYNENDDAGHLFPFISPFSHLVTEAKNLGPSIERTRARQEFVSRAFQIIHKKTKEKPIEQTGTIDVTPIEEKKGTKKSIMLSGVDLSTLLFDRGLVTQAKRDWHSGYANLFSPIRFEGASFYQPDTIAKRISAFSAIPPLFFEPLLSNRRFDKQRIPFQPFKTDRAARRDARGLEDNVSRENTTEGVSCGSEGAPITAGILKTRLRNPLVAPNRVRPFKTRLRYPKPGVTLPFLSRLLFKNACVREELLLGVQPTFPLSYKRSFEKENKKTTNLLRHKEKPASTRRAQDLRHQDTLLSFRQAPRWAYLPVLIGITQAALTSRSFLSAASFQQTTLVLTRSASFGRADFLRGIKERVISGELLLAGTGQPEASLLTDLVSHQNKLFRPERRAQQDKNGLAASVNTNFIYPMSPTIKEAEDKLVRKWTPSFQRLAGRRLSKRSKQPPDVYDVKKDVKIFFNGLRRTRHKRVRQVSQESSHL